MQRPGRSSGQEQLGKVRVENPTFDRGGKGGEKRTGGGGGTSERDGSKQRRQWLRQLRHGPSGRRRAHLRARIVDCLPPKGKAGFVDTPPATDT